MAPDREINDSSFRWIPTSKRFPFPMVSRWCKMDFATIHSMLSHSRISRPRHLDANLPSTPTNVLLVGSGGKERKGATFTWGRDGHQPVSSTCLFGVDVPKSKLLLGRSPGNDLPLLELFHRFWFRPKVVVSHTFCVLFTCCFIMWQNGRMAVWLKFWELPSSSPRIHVRSPYPGIALRHRKRLCGAAAL